MNPRWSRLWFFLSSLLFSGCASNIYDREIETSEQSYVFRGQSLSYWVGVPKGLNANELPVAIFLEGDGGQCQGYSASAFRRFVVRFTGDQILIRPRTFVNTFCEREEFRSFDFFSRVDELSALVAAVRTKHPNAPLYLIGHSAGAHVAILYAERKETPLAGIANLGGGVRDLRAVIASIREERRRLGILSPEEADKEASAFEGTLRDVKQKATESAPFWGRSYRFWYQMFYSGVDTQWANTELPVLVIHGEKDLDSVPFAATLEAKRNFAERGRTNVQFTFFPSLGHDLLTATVFKQVNAWMTDVERARSSAAAPQK